MQGAPERYRAPCSFFCRQGGFTLVELMVTVAIVGILVMVAIPSFLNMRERAKISEAKANLGAIRITEEAYYAEYNRYIGNQPYIPDRTSNPPARFPWTADSRFSILGFAPDGNVFFSYGLAGIDEPLDNFTAQATADLDGDMDFSFWRLSGGDKEMYHEGADL